MTKPVYAYGVVILPPPDLYRELMDLRKQHPLLRSVVPPHITVKSPFLFRQTGARVVEQLEATCERWKPFEIRLGGLGVFQDSILYVRVDKSEELTKLHLEIVEALDGYVETLSDRYDGNQYTPHLTIADRLTPEELIQAKQILKGVRLRRRFTVDRIHLLRGRGRWDLTHTFMLGPT
ncbi:MAG TPA: 2'-5' RNA ligase family protein [Symbiobacteriaceae bacterium]